MSAAEGYVIDLCCDRPEHDKLLSRFGEFCEPTKGEARRKARKDGWLVDWKISDATCPNCARRTAIATKGGAS